MKTNVFERTMRVRQFWETSTTFETSQDSGNGWVVLRKRDDWLKEVSAASKVSRFLNILNTLQLGASNRRVTGALVLSAVL